MKDEIGKVGTPGGGGGAKGVGTEIRKTTCYMCACRCGIDVHVETEGGVPVVRYIDGNRDHPVNGGVICAKGASGIMQHTSPARLMKPLKRVGPRGSGEFEEISWEEALTTAAEWLGEIRSRDPKKLAFFTGRDQSQSFTGLWAQQYGTPNYAAHGGFCSVNMAAGGIYTLGGAFWEFGAPDWERTRLFMMFGVAEDHDSNPLKRGLGALKTRGGAKVIAVNPVRTGYAAIADEWVGITPGTDGLFVLALCHELIRTGHVDLDYLMRWTNAGWLVDRNPGPTFGLFVRDRAGKALVWDRVEGGAVPFDTPGAKPALKGEVPSPDGGRAVPAFELMARKYLEPEYAPEAVAARCGIPAETIRRLAKELADAAFADPWVEPGRWTDFRGETHEGWQARPVSMHAMRGISAHSNGFQTCRAIHLLQLLLGSVESPGGFRFKPPYPKPVEAHPTPHCFSQPDCPLAGPHLGFPRSPADLAFEEDGVTPARIDKAFTWEAPLSTHGMMHMVISNAVAGDPYEIDCLFLYMANMAWNSSMNTAGVMEMLTAKRADGEYKIPKLIYADAYSSETVAYADLVLPDTTYLERHDCISLLDRPICEPDAAADAIRWPVVAPETQAEGRDVRGFQSVLNDLGARLKLPGFVNDDGSQKYADYADYMVHHERRPGVGPLAGWRGDGTAAGRGASNPGQLQRYIENGGIWESHVPADARFLKPMNAGYQEWAVSLGFYDAPQPFVFQIFSEHLRRFQLAAEGHGERQPPDHLRERIRESFDPLPVWWPPFEQAAVDEAEFPLHAITQRPAAMYHAWGSQNAWLRQIHGANPLYVPGSVMREVGLEDGDWAWVISHHGRIRVPVARMEAVNPKTLWTWNAIGKREGAWALGEGATETTKGFLLNHLIHELLPPKGDGLRWANSDPVTGQAAWYDLRVRLEKAEAPAAGRSEPGFAAQRSPVGPRPERTAVAGRGPGSRR